MWWGSRVFLSHLTLSLSQCPVSISLCIPCISSAPSLHGGSSSFLLYIWTWRILMLRKDHLSRRHPPPPSVGQVHSLSSMTCSSQSLNKHFSSSHIWCESWTVKKAEHRRINAFELWCWRLSRIPWTARRSNQSILKEISPGISLEGMMLKLKL